MQPVTQLLIRNAGHPDLSPDTLWYNPPADLPGELANGTLQTQDEASRLRLSATGYSVELNDCPEPSPKFPHIVLTLPRDKARLEMLAHACADALAPGGSLWLVGENRGGIKSSPRILGSRFQQVNKLDSARHCTLLSASNPTQAGPFCLDDWQTTWNLDWRGQELPIASWPGVFAHQRLDEGTSLLLDHLPDFQPGQRILDLGCGAGVISAVALKQCPEAELVAVDTYSLACKATQATLALNQLQAEVIPSDGFSGLDGCFDYILTNPPFHTRAQADTGLSPALLAPARNFLAAGGQLVMVVNRHLPYIEFLQNNFDDWQNLISNNRYSVFSARCRKPRS